MEEEYLAGEKLYLDQLENHNKVLEQCLSEAEEVIRHNDNLCEIHKKRVDLEKENLVRIKEQQKFNLIRIGKSKKEIETLKKGERYGG